MGKGIGGTTLAVTKIAGGWFAGEVGE